jgi:hypothetical protein
MAQTEHEDTQSVGQLVAAASRDMSALVRAEIALAKAEAKQEAKLAAVGGAMFGAAAFVALLAVVMLCIAAAYGLVAAGLHPAWAFLIVAGAFLLLAGLLVLVGVTRVKKIGPPERTIRTVRDTLDVVKNPRGNGESAPAGTGASPSS